MGMVTIQRNMLSNGKTGMIFGGQDGVLGETDFSMLESLVVDTSHRFPNSF